MVTFCVFETTPVVHRENPVDASRERLKGTEDVSMTTGERAMDYW